VTHDEAVALAAEVTRRPLTLVESWLAWKATNQVLRCRFANLGGQQMGRFAVSLSMKYMSPPRSNAIKPSAAQTDYRADDHPSQSRHRTPLT
jgi:hypothetical protein